MQRLRRFLLVLVAILPAVLPEAAQFSLAAQEPESSKLRELLDPIMEKAVADHRIPGGVLLVGHNSRVVYRKAFGSRSMEPTQEPMTVDTIFDLASLTKCIATTTSVMKLVEDGRVRLNDPVAAYLPEFAQNGKQDITVRELMTHYSGLAPDLDLKTAWQGRDAAFEMAMQQTPVNPAGKPVCLQRYQLRDAWISGGEGLRNAAERIRRTKRLCAAGHETHAFSASG